VLFSLEQLFTAVNPFVKRANHLVGSVVLQAGYFIVNYILAFLVVMWLNGIDNNRIGLFNVIAIPYWLKVIIGIICIDFVNYWEHRVTMFGDYSGGCIGCVTVIR